MKASSKRNWGVPLIFFILTIVAYGLMLPQTGFYWDDWPFVWIAKFLGPADFFPAFSNIRPFLAPIFFITTSLLPPEPVYWQIFMLLIRFVSGLLAWFIFSQVWPRHRRSALVASFLFLLFPGYSQHWVAFTHINQEWIAFLFYLLSFGFTARALRNPDKFRSSTFIALLFLVLGVFPTEYFIGLEPLRFLFIWIIVADGTNDFKQKLLISFKQWLPYLVIWLIDAAWLGYFFFARSFGSYDVELVTEPVSILGILKAVAEAIWKGGFYIWGQVLVLASRTYSAPSTILTILLIAGSCGLLFLYLKRWETREEEKSAFAIQMTLIGLAGILLGRLPSFAAGLPLTLQSSNDRFMISMMIGGSLFITGLVELLIDNIRIKTFVFALLIALGIGQQFYNANIFRRDWLNQQRFYSQLAWRIPAMEPGTLLVTDQLPVDYETDLSFSAPINWIYAPEYTRSQLPYGLIYTEKRLGGSLPSLKPGEEVKVYLRTVNFEGSTSKAIVLFMPEHGCLRVLGSAWNDEITYSGQSKYLVKAIPLSNPDLIRVNAVATPKLPFLAEAKHDWCYYYTKAELARQSKDWNGVNALLSEATSLGYQAGDPFEWLVFIEAKAMTGDLKAASDLSEQIFKSEQKTRRGICQVWKRVQANSPTESLEQHRITGILSEFQCGG
jgi:hypothetical protein